MANFFNTNSALSEEEQVFKGVDYDFTKKLNPQEGYENIQEKVIKPIGNFLTDSGNEVQYNNVVNMAGVEVPTYNEIKNMDYNALTALRKKILNKQKNATSKTFSTGYNIALQNIDRELLNKTPDDDVAAVNADTSAIDNPTNVATSEIQENEIDNAKLIQTNIEADQIHNANVWESAIAEADKIIENTSPELIAAQNNQITSTNVLAEGAILSNEADTIVAKGEFDRGQGELELEANASTTEVTEDDAKSAVLKIKEELMAIMPESEIPAELLMMKFGANLLRAKSNRRGKLPAFLEEVAASLDPITDTLIAYDMKQKENDRALAASAYEIYSAQTTAASKADAKRYEFQDLFNVFAAEYDTAGNGLLTGGSSLMGQITTPAEMDYYASLRYPDEASVTAGTHTKEQLEATPDYVRGNPMFVINKTSAAKEDFGSPVYKGMAGDNKTAFASATERALFLQNAIKNDAQMVQIVAMGMAPGAQPQTGYGAKLGSFTQNQAAKLNSLAKFFGVEDGVPILNNLSGETEYKQFYEGMAAAGHDFTPQGIHTSITNDIKAMYDYNDKMLNVGGPDQLSEQEWALNKSYINILSQTADSLKGREGLNIMESLMQKSAFGRARYLQGSNRLLRDVIREAQDIMNVYKSGDRQMLAKLNDNILKYQDDYNSQLALIWDPITQSLELDKNRLIIDQDYNVTGGILSSGNVSSQSPQILGSSINLNDPSVSAEIGEQQQFNSLQDMFTSFGMEMPKEFK